MPLGQGFTRSDNQILRRVNHKYNRNPAVSCITPCPLAESAKAVTAVLEAAGELKNGRSRGEGTRKSSSLMPLGQGFTRSDNQILRRVNHKYNRNPAVSCITPSPLAESAKAVTAVLEAAGKLKNGRSRGEGTRKSTSPMPLGQGFTHNDNQILRRINYEHYSSCTCGTRQREVAQKSSSLMPVRSSGTRGS